MSADWVPLIAVLEERTWTAETAVLIVAGLDPATTVLFPSGDDDPRIEWLPHSLPQRWEGLPLPCLRRRAIKLVQVAAARLHGLPGIATPRQWIVEAEHRGIAPPWRGGARARPRFAKLLPPSGESTQSRRAKQLHANGRWSAAREAVRGLWEAWVLRETSYPNKAVFIAEAAEQVAGADSINGNLVGEWIAEWEREWMEPYGLSGRVADFGSKGYAGHATTLRKRQNRSRVPRQAG